jgi:hypothetical protein
MATPVAPPAHGDGRVGAALCAATGFAVGVLAVVLGAHSNISGRYRTLTLGAGVVWLVVSLTLLGLIGGAWRWMRRTGKTLVQITAGILVLAPLAVPIVVVLFAVGPMRHAPQGRRRRPLRARLVQRTLGAAVIGGGGFAYIDAVGGRPAAYVAACVVGVCAFAALALVDRRHAQRGARAAI